MSTKHAETNDIVRRAHAVGTYYGFTPLSSAIQSKKREADRAPYPEGLKLETLDPVAKEVAGFLKSARDGGIAPNALRPYFLWHTNAAPGRPAPKQIVIQFHVLGVDRAIADAVLIRAMRSLISDIAKDEPSLRINSMGDKETRGRLARELGSFFRKRGATLPPECAEQAKSDVFKAAETLSEHEDTCGLPSPTDHLSEASRKHFEAVLEYLESTETPYELAPDLMSRGGIWGETCFELIAGEGIHAWGSRYHDLAKMFFKSNTPSVGAVIRIASPTREVVPSLKERLSPRFVFVHIGDEAKRESMKMADALRRARIPMTQTIGIESLTEQMRVADTYNPRYLLIMGRKEALSRSVILRERSTHTETFIPFDSLVEQLREVA
jgi:histidyl-tRNA synthetase